MNGGVDVQRAKGVQDWSTTSFEVDVRDTASVRMKMWLSSQNKMKQGTVSEQVKDGVSALFEQNPEFSRIGSQEEYSNYLSSIFPESQVKDIVYRGQEKGSNRLFQYFTKNSTEAYMYAKANITKGGKITERNPYTVIAKTLGNYLDTKYGPNTFKIFK